jgi:Family of unknown function (DUF5677)
VAAHVADDLPVALVAPSVRARVALWVATRSLARLRTIQLLLQHRQADDALILLRPLISDSQRMQYIAKRPPSDRDGLVVAWLDHALSEWDGIAHAATSSGQTAFAASIREKVDTERRALDRSRPTPRGSLPAEGVSLARSIGHTDDEVDYVLATKSSHGSITSTLRHVEVGPDGIVFHMSDPDPEYPREIARRACRHMVRLSATAAIVGDFPEREVAGAYAAEIEDRLDVEDAEDH